MLDYKNPSEIRQLARAILKFAPESIAETTMWNAAHPDAMPKDCEYQRVAAYYARKVLRALRTGAPVDQRWVNAMIDGDALPEY